MKTFIFIALGLLTDLHSNAAESLKVGQTQSVGRLTLFRGDREYSYLFPSAFSTNLECEDLGNKSECFLYVYNSLSQDEKEAINKIGAFVPISSFLSIVKSVDESISSPFSDLNVEKIKLTESMVISDSPYATTRFVVSKERAKEIAQTFNSANLGTFKQEVILRVSDTIFYLSIVNSIVLKQWLLKLQGESFSGQRLKEDIRELIKNLQLKSKGLSYEESLTLLANTIIERFFKRSWAGRYQVIMENVRAINGEPLVFIDDTENDLPYQCSVILDLKNGAKPISKCRELE